MVINSMLTMHGSVVTIGIDSLVPHDLDVLATGSAVELVGSSQPAAHAVREHALLVDVGLEIRRGLVLLLLLLHSILSNKPQRKINNKYKCVNIYNIKKYIFVSI